MQTYKPSACVAGIVRIPLLLELKIYDLPYTAVIAGLWINVECNIGIVSACLPTLRPLLNMAPSLPRSVKSRIRSSRFSGKSSQPNSTGLSGKTITANSTSDPMEKKSLPLPLNAAHMGYQNRIGYNNHLPAESVSTNDSGGSIEALPQIRTQDDMFGTRPKSTRDIEMGIMKGEQMSSSTFRGIC